MRASMLALAVGLFALALVATEPLRQAVDTLAPYLSR